MSPPTFTHPSELAVKIHDGLFAIGGIGYTINYILMTRQSIRDRTYSMPLLSLAFNFAWEMVFALFVADRAEEQIAFTVWMIIDVGLIYGVVKYGANEWKHAPVVGRNIGKIFAVFLAWWCWALYSLSIWWLDADNLVNPKVGRSHKGVEGRDAEEFAYWTAVVAQVILSVGSLAQLLIRGSSRGTSYSIWATRFIGSLAGLNGCQVFSYYKWPDVYPYCANPFAICLAITWVLADVLYLVLLVELKGKEGSIDSKRTEPDGARAKVS